MGWILCYNGGTSCTWVLGDTRPMSLSGNVACSPYTSRVHIEICRVKCRQDQK